MSDLVVMTREDLDYLVQRLGEALAGDPDAPEVITLDVEQVGEPRLVEAYDVGVTLTTLEEVYDDEEPCLCPECLDLWASKPSWCDCE